MTKEQRKLNNHLHNKVICSPNIISYVIGGSSAIFYTSSKIESIHLNTVDSIEHIVISLSHELGHFNFLLNKYIRRLMWWTGMRSRYNKNRYKLQYSKNNKFTLPYNFITYVWEMLAWWNAKKELSRINLWTFNFRKEFTAFRKKCLKTYLNPIEERRSKNALQRMWIQ